uniref:Uncharacterized protein n=1 Tax=Oryza glumipatula TaxID=40148 RepID=A0A0D9Y6E0_9ORYZ
MAGYFDANDEASEICKQLLTNIKNAQRNYLSMDSFLATISDSVAATDGTVAPLAAVRSNPLSRSATRRHGAASGGSTTDGRIVGGDVPSNNGWAHWPPLPLPSLPGKL